MSKFAPHHKSSNNPRATTSSICQRCLGRGHFIYQCKQPVAPYVSRPSRTQLLENPSLRKNRDGPSIELPEEFQSKSGTANKILEAKEKAREKLKDNEPPKKRTKRSRSDSGSESESSSSTSSNSDSDSSNAGSGSPRARSRSRSKERDRKRRLPARDPSRDSSSSVSSSDPKDKRRANS